MIVKYGKFKTGYELETSFMEETYDIYEKTEGNYKEYLLNKSVYSNGFIENGVKTEVDHVEEINFEVLPNTTLDNILTRFPSSQYLTWVQELTTIS